MNLCKDCGWCSKKIYVPPIGQSIEFLYCTLNDFKTDTSECTRWISKGERAELEALKGEIAEEWAIDYYNELMESYYYNQEYCQFIEESIAVYDERKQLAEAKEIVDKDFEEEANWDPNKEDI